MTPRIVTNCTAFSVVVVAYVLVAARAETLGTVPAEPGTPKDIEMQKADQPASEEPSANHLIHETSPYLLQHAHNPVDWYPWRDEALRRACDEDKPIFLSIGYAACHWCHVMERESFEDAETAALLNEHFVSIKVDREERPDLDTIYMTAVQLMTGRGGWPMTVFLTPDLKPFYGGTYFPPDDRHGMPSFKTVLNAVLDAWRDRRSDVVDGAAQLTDHIARSANQSAQADDTVFTDALLARATQQLAHDYDSQFGGFTPAPKFPSPFAIAALLREYNHTKDQHTLDMATFTLKQMANGGMYDHLGGGFHRYSVDERWLVPHFEKMLYDNALLSQVYLEAYQVTHDPLFRRIAEETFAYVIGDMQSPVGAFYSTEDADSEGQEGKFYIWTHDEILSALGEHDGALFCAYYNVQPSGNFPSHESYHTNQNILHVTQDPESFAASQSVSVEEWNTKLSAMRARLLAERARRIRPALDDKILTSWNALMISSLAQGYQILGNEAYRTAALSAATRAADFIVANMMHNGELLHTHRNGQSRVPAYLDDYAFLLVAFVDLYEATFEPKWLDHADALATAMLARFWDDEQGGFFFTAAGQDNLIARSKPVFDGAEPSGNAMAALGLLRLAKLTGNADFAARAVRTLVGVSGNLAAAPHGMFKTLCAVDFFIHPPKEIVIVGPITSEPVRALLKTLHERFIPNKVVAAFDPAERDADLMERIPLLESKGLVDGRPAAYVCEHFTCKQPAATPEALAAVLASE